MLRAFGTTRNHQQNLIMRHLYANSIVVMRREESLHSNKIWEDSMVIRWYHVETDSENFLVLLSFKDELDQHSRCSYIEYYNIYMWDFEFLNLEFICSFQKGSKIHQHGNRSLFLYWTRMSSYKAQFSAKLKPDSRWLSPMYCLNTKQPPRWWHEVTHLEYFPTICRPFGKERVTEIFQTFDLSMTSVMEVIFNRDICHQGCQQSTSCLPPKSTSLSEQAMWDLLMLV